MTNTVQVTVRMDHNLVEESKDFLKECGLSFSQGMQILLRRMLREGKLVMEPAYNAETLEAIREAEDISAHPERYKSYASFDEMMQDLHVSEEKH